MPQPAARTTDLHVCPMVTALVPHVGGPIAPPGGPPVELSGSGVVIDADKGFVLTNDHLVQGSSGVVVILRDGQERQVSQVRRDPKTDLALLIIDGKGLSAAEWGDSDSLDIGDWVLAIGQPFGGLHGIADWLPDVGAYATQPAQFAAGRVSRDFEADVQIGHRVSS